MSREIKFRAWDEEWQVMSVPMMLFLNGQSFFFFKGFGARCCNHKQLKVMQYTGIKDKDGVEMDWWESDFLQPVDGSCRVGIIEYSLNLAAYEVHDEFGERICSLGTACCDGWEKVGNVHQNPELPGQQCNYK